MGIYLPNMEMPKTCHCCSMCVQVSDGDIDWHWKCCLLCEEVARYATDRIPGCPLVPVPKHGRLIDADALIQNKEVNTFEAVFAVAKAPTIIPESGGKEDE